MTHQPEGTPSKVVQTLADQLRLENDRMIQRMLDGGRHAQEHGHRFLLLVSTVLALAIPGVATAKLIDPGWLKWSAIWFAACLTFKVLALRGSEYLIAHAVTQRTAFTNELFGATFKGNEGIAAFVETLTAFNRWGNTLPKLASVSLIVSDIFVYGAFLAGVFCLCGGLLATG